MSEEDLLIFIKAIEMRVQHVYKFVEKINYDIGAIVKDEIKNIHRSEILALRSQIHEINKSCKELKKQNDMLRNELRLTKQSKKIMEFLKEDKDERLGNSIKQIRTS